VQVENKAIEVQGTLSVNLNQEGLERAQARGNVYALLALGFYEPSPQLAENLLDGSLTAALQESLGVLQEAPPFTEELATIDEFCEDQRAKTGEDFRSLLNLEYTRLFIGPGHLPCPPYESVYRADVPAQERGLLMGRATVEVRRKYSQAGLGVASDHKDLPDHVATELEFMYFLCQKEVEAWEKSNPEQALEWSEMQQEFLKEHLSLWIPAFCEAVEEASNVQFYGSLAATTQAYVALEVDRVGSLLDELRRTTTSATQA